MVEKPRIKKQIESVQVKAIPALVLAIMSSAAIMMWSTTAVAVTQDPIFAQGQLPPTVDVIGWANIVSSTGFAGLVWLLMVKTLPNMQTRFDERTDKSEIAWALRFSKQEEAWALRYEAQANAHKHDLDRILQTFEKTHG